MDEPISEPIDPAAAALVARVRRLMLFTMAATFLALAIVLTFIGYRVFNAGGSTSTASDMSVTLPAGARVLSSSVGDGKIAVTIEINGAAQILLYDQKTLVPVGRVRLMPQ